MMNASSSNNWTWCNESEPTRECGVSDRSRTPSYWALVLLLIPSLTLFGNLLVIISVVSKRNLHSPINYFILGLAIADMCVAMAVMPFAVYVEYNEDWELGTVLCDLYCAADVTCSTASIFLLTVISFDRYVAATQPIRYANSAKGIGRVAVINLAVWLVSMLIASPMVLGLNNVPDRDLSKCMFYNADFIIYSSTGSFCIPLAIIVYLYARIYCVIRQRGRFAKQRQDLISAASRCSVVTAGYDSTEKPLLLPKAPLPSVIEYPLSLDNDDIEEKEINSVYEPDQAPAYQGDQNGQEEQQGKSICRIRNDTMNLLSPAIPALGGGKLGGRSSSFRVGCSRLEVQANGASNHKTVLRSRSSSSTLPTRDSSKALEGAVRKNGHAPIPDRVVTQCSRHFSLPQKRRLQRRTRHWSLASSTNVMKETPLDFDISSLTAMNNNITILGQETPITLPKNTDESETVKTIRSSRLSSLSTSPRGTRHPSVAIDSVSSVTIICPSPSIYGHLADDRRTPSISVQRRSPKASFSSMVSGMRRLNNRKRLSEGCSPLLRDSNRFGLFAAHVHAKRSLDETAQAAKARWLRRLSTRLVLWRFQREGRFSDPCTDTTTSAIEREGIKQPLLYRRAKTPRKSLSKSQRKEKKATKTLAIVLGIFLICWLPFFTLNLLNAVCIKLDKEICQVGFLPFFLTTWLGYTNSLMNPIIYTIFNADFRRAFKDILCSCFSARRMGRRT